MPLTRATVTVAQRVMVPVNIVFAAALGYGYTFEATRLVTSPPYRSANEILPLPVWGVGFLGVAAWLTLAAVTSRRSVFVAGLAWLGVWMAVWAGVFIAVYFKGDASFLAWTFPAYVAAACWASMLSLLAREA